MAAENMEANEMSVLMDAMEDKLEALRKDILLLSSLRKFAIRRASSNVRERFSSVERDLQLLLEIESSRNKIMDGRAELPSEQADCAVCLEILKSDECLAHLLPCAHRFHSKCLVRWLKINASCPCCRMTISLS